MKSLTTQLSQYARYHRSKRNILTHFFDIPLIVIAVMGLTFVPITAINQVAITLTMVLAALLCSYYLVLSLPLGIMMTAVLLVFYAVVAQSNAYFEVQGYWSWAIWLSVFVLGWVLQFIGHYFEGKKPAFVDDIVGLAIGPLFVLVELLFLLGFMPQLEQQIIAQAGEYRA